MIPSLAVVHVHNPHWHRRVRLWVPLILLYIPLLILSPLILLIGTIACVAGHVNPWRTMTAFWSLFCGLTGTDVCVQSEGNQVLVRIL
jgi:hypothetical protein